MVASEWSPPETFEEYRLVRALGRGAMGLVYLAHDSLLDRAVAVKFVQAAEDPEARARFFDEARAIARLQHPNVVAIYRVADVAGHPCLVSEYVRGRSLDQLDRPVPWRQVLAIAIDLARGLAAAHRCGVLHRDVKPANAMLTDDGRAKLLDFGLATVIDSNAIDPLVPPREREAGSNRHLASIETTLPAAPREPLTLGRGSPNHGFAGTPLYTAPELWRGDPATRRSDLYSLGILVYELLAGAAPHRGVPAAELGDIVQHRDIPRVGEIVAGCDPALASIVDRLVERDAGARFPSADALLAALEECAAPAPLDHVPDGNPYRGLAAFEAAHGTLFFGRRGEIRELVDRVRTDAFVVVGGDSGTGKSSLCRAGVLPWLVEHDGWSRVDVIPGTRPVHALAAALAAWSGADEAALDALLRDTPDAAARAIRQTSSNNATPRKLLLFVDQLEELLTLSDPGEARVAAGALAALAVRTPAVRVVATARSDFLSRLALLPGLGDEMSRGLYFLRPLAGERIREAIVRPAAAKGVTFESEELIDTLIEQTEHAPGGLPLLQFTLAELWDARDLGTRTIRAETLAAFGGVEGALTRHADRILAGLDASGREAARRLLLRLVTAEGTRARRAEAELLTGGGERAALEVLVRGRVVVANDAQDGAYEIAHEALLASWSTLQGWLERGAAEHAVRRRIEHAAMEWDRSGRARDLLWRRRQLAEAKAIDRETLAASDAAFLAAATRAVSIRRVIAAATAAVAVIAAISIGLVVRARARAQLESVVAKQRAGATAAIDAARTLARERDAVRTRAFALFDAQHWSEGEELWTKVEALGVKETGQYRAASGDLESALALDPTLRPAFADLLFERLLRAETDHRDDAVDELAGRLAAYDDGRHAAALAASAHIELEVPRGTKVWSTRANASRELLGEAPLAPLTVDPGELELWLDVPGRVPLGLPLRIARAETVKLAVDPPASIPEGMIYIPPGRFLFGSADGSDLRRGFLNAPPIHDVTTAGYLIGRHEVTFAEWIEFLDDLPIDERRRRTPSSDARQSSFAIALAELGPKRWRLTFGHATTTYTAEMGERIHYTHRTSRADQDWLRFPVVAVTYEDALTYAAWLDRTRRLPGARICDEYEWERAARGADARPFPNGDSLATDDANIDATYGREPSAYGPDEVGSHAGSRSPFGVDDMAGNVWEWTRSVETPGAAIIRGGGWYQAEINARTTNREAAEPTLRDVSLGVRICASAAR